MGWEERVSEVLSPSDMLYAVGQGALAIQCRTEDNAMLDLLSKLSDPSTVLRVIAERTFMQTLGKHLPTKKTKHIILLDLNKKMSSCANIGIILPLPSWLSSTITVYCI